MYDLETDQLIEQIKEEKIKKILIQLPDGLKPKAQEIVDKIQGKTNAEVIVWLGTCYGACDLPLKADFMKFDLVIQYGHNKFIKQEW